MNRFCWEINTAAQKFEFFWPWNITGHVFCQPLRWLFGTGAILLDLSRAKLRRFNCCMRWFYRETRERRMVVTESQKNDECSAENWSQTRFRPAAQRHPVTPLGHFGTGTICLILIFETASFTPSFGHESVVIFFLVECFTSFEYQVKHLYLKLT